MLPPPFLFLNIFSPYIQKSYEMAKNLFIFCSLFSCVFRSFLSYLIQFCSFLFSPMQSISFPDKNFPYIRKSPEIDKTSRSKNDGSAFY